jgi:hypothetical protein
MTEMAPDASAHDCTPHGVERAEPLKRRLSLVLVQEAPGFWVARGLEHDIVGQGRSIGAAVHAAVSLIEAHTAFDIRHDHTPLCAFRPAPQSCWNAQRAGTPLSLSQLGIAPPAGWEICAALAHARQSDR